MTIFSMTSSLLAVYRDFSAAISTFNMFHRLCLEWILAVLFEGNHVNKIITVADERSLKSLLQRYIVVEKSKFVAG